MIGQIAHVSRIAGCDPLAVIAGFFERQRGNGAGQFEAALPGQCLNERRGHAFIFAERLDQMHRQCGWV